MQLLAYITNLSSKIPELLGSLVKVGVSGATVVNCEGMAHILGSNNTPKRRKSLEASGAFSRTNTSMARSFLRSCRTK